MLNQNGKIRVCSLFSGIGGFELGIIGAIGERADFVAYSEIDKYAIQIYEKHFKQRKIRVVGSKSTDTKPKSPKSEIQFGGKRSTMEKGNGVLSTDNRRIGAVPCEEEITTHKNYGDITTIDTSDLPDFDLLCGGFPCQSFSIAGKRGGFDDTRGTLFFEIARIARDKKPRYLLLENVKGLLSHDGGNTFTTIIRVLSDIGYDLQWEVCNSKNFGVPQNRERVFIVGHLRGEPRPKVFPIGESNSGIDEARQGGKLRKESVTSALKARDYKDGTTFVAMTEMRTESAKKIRRETKDRDFSPRRGKLLKKRTDNIGNCVTAGQGKEHFLTSDTKIRRLTPTECARLQGFPDDWHEGLSDTQAYKCYGNAVTTNVIKDIMVELLK